MQIIDATHSHKHDENCGCASEQSPENPAAHHSKYHVEFGFQPKTDDMKAPEFPEITVNGVALDEHQILNEMQYHPADSQRKALVQAAQTLIINELLRQQAKAQRLLDETVEQGSNQEAEIFDLLVKQQVPTPDASDEECQRFYQQFPEKFASPAIVEAKHILLAAPADDVMAREQAQQIAQQLINQLADNPAKFDDLVAKHSMCPSREQGGNLGQISKGQTVPEFERVLLKSEAGLVNFPIESRYGFHVVVIERKIEGTPLPFEAVKLRIKEYLQDKVQRKATAQYIQTLISDAEITGFSFDVEQSPLMQ